MYIGLIPHCEFNRFLLLGSKRTRHGRERTKSNTRSKSNILCCYWGDDIDKTDTGGHFTVKYDQTSGMQVEESARDDRVNGQSSPPRGQINQVEITDENQQNVTVNVTNQTSETNMTSQMKAATITVEVVPITSTIEMRKVSDSATESSSKRESGIELAYCSTHADDDIINTVPQQSDVTTSVTPQHDITNTITENQFDVIKGVIQPQGDANNDESTAEKSREVTNEIN